MTLTVCALLITVSFAILRYMMDKAKGELLKKIVPVVVSLFLVSYAKVFLK